MHDRPSGRRRRWLGGLSHVWCWWTGVKFQLAATMPSSILAELLGTSDVNAAAWAALAARDWGAYVHDRASGR